MELKRFTTPQYLAWCWRIPIIVLLCVELGSLGDYIPAKPSYTAVGLFIQSLVFYFAFEVTNYYLLKVKRVPPWWVATSLVFLLAMDAVGDYLGWYHQFFWYDAVLHFLIPTVATLGIWALRHTFGGTVTYRWLFLCVVPGVTTLAAMYEMEEYLEDLISGSHRLGDGFDTANDLLMGFLGSLLPVLIHYLVHKIKQLIILKK